MPAKIKADVLQALDNWKAGKPVKSIALGHVHRMTHSEEHMASYPNSRNPVDLSKRFSNDQERAHAYCFAVIDAEESSISDNFEEFLLSCRAVRKHFPEVTHEEALAAEALAWKALHVGWARAIAGHDPSLYIEVSNPAVNAA